MQCSKAEKQKSWDTEKHRTGEGKVQRGEKLCFGFLPPIPQKRTNDFGTGKQALLFYTLKNVPSVSGAALLSIAGIIVSLLGFVKSQGWALGAVGRA